MLDRSRVSWGALLLSLLVFLLALPLNSTTAANLNEMTHQPTTVSPENERRGMSVAGTPHDPIVIDEDSDFNNQGWPGSGTEESPYVIEGLDITSDGNCISISNTNVHFRIM